MLMKASKGTHILYQTGTEYIPVALHKHEVGSHQLHSLALEFKIFKDI